MLRIGSWGLIIRILALVAGMVSSVVLARVLGPTQFGVYSFIFAIITMLAMPAQLGLPTLVVRETAKALEKKEWGQMAGLWRWAIYIVVLSSAIVIGLSILASWGLNTLMTPLYWEVFLYGVILIPLLAGLQSGGAMLHGLHHVVAGLLPDQVIRPLFLALIIGLTATITPGSLTAIDAMEGHMLAALIALMIITWGYYRYRPIALKTHHKQNISHRAWWKALLPLTMTSGIFMISFNTDIIVLGLFRTEEEVGFYKIAMSAASLAFMGVTALRLVILPHITRLFEQNNQSALQKLMEQTAMLSFVVTLAAAILFLFFGEWLIDLLYGSAYTASYTPLMILIAGYIVFSFYGPIGALLFMTGLERVAFKIVLWTTTFNIALDFLLIPTWGITGAAIASAFSTALFSSIFWLVAKKRIAINSSVWAYLKTAFHTS